MPISGCVPRECEVSPLMFRRGRWSLENSLDDDFGYRAATERESKEGGKTTVMPLQMWPMAPGAVAFDILVPESMDGGESAVIRLDGFREGFSANLLADGRLKAVWSGGCKGPVWKQAVEHLEEFEGRRTLCDGRWHRVVLENDAKDIRIVIDGETDAECHAEPFRAYGRCTVSLPENKNVRVKNLEIGVAGFVSRATPKND